MWKMQEIDKLILFLLSEAQEPMTTYEIAQEIGISWSTANSYLWKLKDKGKVELLIKRNRFVKKHYWRLRE